MCYPSLSSILSKFRRDSGKTSRSDDGRKGGEAESTMTPSKRTEVTADTIGFHRSSVVRVKRRKMRRRKKKSNVKRAQNKLSERDIEIDSFFSFQILCEMLRL
jgi:hypothetical protein